MYYIFLFSVHGGNIVPSFQPCYSQLSLHTPYSHQCLTVSYFSSATNTFSCCCRAFTELFGHSWKPTPSFVLVRRRTHTQTNLFWPTALLLDLFTVARSGASPRPHRWAPAVQAIMTPSPALIKCQQQETGRCRGNSGALCRFRPLAAH